MNSVTYKYLLNWFFVLYKSPCTRTLFPYVSARLPDFVAAQAAEPHLAQVLETVKQTVLQEQARAIDDRQAVAQLPD